MKNFRVYVIGTNDLDPLRPDGLIGWKGIDHDGQQYGSVFKIPGENFEEFLKQIEKICHARTLARVKSGEGQKLEEMNELEY